jgi:hypothetical protein
VAVDPIHLDQWKDNMITTTSTAPTRRVLDRRAIVSARQPSLDYDAVIEIADQELQAEAERADEAQAMALEMQASVQRMNACPNCGASARSSGKRTALCRDCDLIDREQDLIEAKAKPLPGGGDRTAGVLAYRQAKAARR